MLMTAASKAVCIFGMHRSGTSCVSRAFNLGGVYLGEAGDMLTPSPANPEGYWEHREINGFQERCLDGLKRRWDTLLPIAEGVWGSAELSPFREELSTLVRSRFAGRPLWGWKDPRSCLLLPLWKSVLAGLSAELTCCLVVRSPGDVASSLRQRDGFGIAKSEGLWLHYTAAALRAARGTPTVVLSYDDLLERGAAELERCFRELGLPWPMGEEECAALERFLRLELRHHRVGTTTAERSSPAERLYHALGTIRSAGTDLWAELPEGVHRDWETHVASARIFEADLLAGFDYRQRLVALERWLAASRQDPEGLKVQLGEARARMAALESQLAVLRASLSWRITRPVRAVAGALGIRCGRAGTRPR